MAKLHRVWCGSGTPPRCPNDGSLIRLCLEGNQANVNFRIGHLSKQLSSRLTDMDADLLEIAAYVYAADQAITRGGTQSFEYGLRWRRSLRFEIPVRQLDFWQSAAIQAALRTVLTFLSDDDYAFVFRKATVPAPVDRYLFETVEDSSSHDFQEVMLFSGGLDSLAGAVQEILQCHRKIVLVSHRPNSKIDVRQRQLFDALCERLPRKPIRPLHVSITINKRKSLSREFTQRSRSFLFAAVAAVTAHALGLPGIRFYENGVISFHLPLSPQVLGARASRTTHPRVLRGFQRLFELIYDQEFTVTNPFELKTKAELLSALKATGHGKLCALTSSCAHTHMSTIEHPHCGLCSQCVDRRLTALAAGLTDDEDPPSGYGSDVICGPREGADLILMERYYGTALQLLRMPADPIAFLIAYPETARALKHAEFSTAEMATQILQLSRHHADQVCKGLEPVAGKFIGDVIRQNLPSNTLLGLIGQHLPQKQPSQKSDGSEIRIEQPNWSRLVFDGELFAIRWGNLPLCRLGNTLEYHFLYRLHRDLGKYVSYSALGAAVWQDPDAMRGTIHRVACNLRQKLHKNSYVGVDVNGSEKGHYRLIISPPEKK